MPVDMRRRCALATFLGHARGICRGDATRGNWSWGRARHCYGAPARCGAAPACALDRVSDCPSTGGGRRRLGGGRRFGGGSGGGDRRRLQCKRLPFGALAKAVRTATKCGPLRVRFGAQDDAGGPPAASTPGPSLGASPRTRRRRWRDARAAPSRTAPSGAPPDLRRRGRPPVLRRF